MSYRIALSLFALLLTLLAGTATFAYSAVPAAQVRAKTHRSAHPPDLPLEVDTGSGTDTGL